MLFLKFIFIWNYFWHQSENPSGGNRNISIRKIHYRTKHIQSFFECVAVIHLFTPVKSESGYSAAIKTQ